MMSAPVVQPTMVEEDVVPTIDDLERLNDHEAPPATYRDWTPDQTRVITYTTNPTKYPKDRPAFDRIEARAQCELVFGRILEANYLPEQFFFRVYRTRPSK